jgi:tetratricopeptide (TPR) repeat protein
VLASIASATDIPNKKAIEYLEKAIQFSPQSARFSRNNMGIEYMKLKNYFKAISIFQEVLDESSRRNDSASVAIANNNLGDAFLDIRNYDSAYVHISRTLLLSTLRHDQEGLMYDNLLMGKFYVSVGKFRQAKIHLYRSLDFDKRLGEIDENWTSTERPRLYQHLVDIYTAERNLDSVAFFKNKLIELYKSLFNKQKQSNAEFIFADQEGILQAFIQKQSKERKSMTEYYGIALVLLVAIIIYFLFTGRDRQRKFAPFISMIVVILTFEFLLIVLDPFTSKVTGGDPLIGFLINVVLAMILIPAEKLGEKVFKKFALDIRLKRMEQETE